jgi:hydroxypyruvate isomerase
VLDGVRLLPAFQSAGCSGYLGCEYRPAASVEAGPGARDIRRRIGGSEA